jgi:choline dehydrogenase
VAEQRFDYIIVGAGSAGSVIAGKLVARGHRVLLLEAGGHDRHPWVRLPIGYARTFFDRRFNWCFEAEPDRGTNNRRSYWPRGKVIGGSSSINALCYVRAHPRDFADWQAAGNTSWSWQEALKYYQRFERRIAADGTANQAAGLAVNDVSAQYHPLTRVFAKASTEMGLPITADFNSTTSPCEGIGPYRITTDNGRRCSAADAFLRPFMRHSNLSVRVNCEAQKIVFSGKRAVAVEYRYKRRLHTVHADAEVIVCAGAIGSPHLLMRSGVGPGAALRTRGVEVIHHSPQVGQNLQDHLGISYYFKATVPTLNDELRSWRQQARAAWRYVVSRSGPLALSVNQYGGFIRTSRDLLGPDIQLYFNPIAYNTNAEAKTLQLTADSRFILSFSPTRPVSRGHLELNDKGVEHAPRIHPGYLSASGDLDTVAAGGKFLRQFAQTAALQNVVASQDAPILTDMSDTDLVDDFRARAGTVYHPVGTCTMNPDPQFGVVDQSLRVHGMSALRVIDASVFPTITTGNTNATTIMLAHRAADLVLARRG